MNKNHKRTYWATQKANQNKGRQSKKPKVGAKVPSKNDKGPSIMDQQKMLGYYKTT